MKYIFLITGRSATGKDTIYQKVMERLSCLHKVVMYTTRPMRDGEVNGREYFFVTYNDYVEYKKKGLVVEAREYETISGLWVYFTVASNDLTENNIMMLGTLEMLGKLREYFKNSDETAIIPILIEVDCLEMLQRAVGRELVVQKFKDMGARQKAASELCRRYLHDDIDFSEKKILESSIEYRVKNNELEECISEVINIITKYI